MTSAVSAVTAVYSTQTAMAKLALTEWLVTKAAAISGREGAGQNGRFF